MPKKMKVVTSLTRKVVAKTTGVKNVPENIKDTPCSLERIEKRFKEATGMHEGKFETDKEKSRTFAEVFTPLHIVDQMIGTIPEKGMTSDTKNLDLCAGQGQFSIRMLRKLQCVDVDSYLQKNHYFSELQISSCYKLLWIFGDHINLAIGDALHLAELPKGYHGAWYYLEAIKEWVNVNGLIRAMRIGAAEVYSKDKEDLFVKAFEGVIKRLNTICREYKVNIKQIVEKKNGRKALMKFAAEAASGIEKNWQENETPEWVVREMVASVPDIDKLKRILVLFNIEFLECLIKERGIDPCCVDFGYDSEIEGALADKIYGAHVFSLGKNLLEMQLATEDKAGQYDVVFSNPPYQVSDGGFGASAKPIYHEIVMYAIDHLKPQYICMITPSRWMAGGKGLDDYRKRMLADKHIKMIQDFPDAREVFPNVIIKGGISYFFWDKNYSGLCSFNGVERELGEFDVVVRDNITCLILRKVLGRASGFCDKKVLPRKPFGLRTNFESWVPAGTIDAVKCYARNLETKYLVSGYSDDNKVKSMWKVCTSRGINPNLEGRFEIYNQLFISEPDSICTETYLVTGSFNTKKETDNYLRYMKTKFYRCLLSLRVITQDMSREKFSWVPDLGDYSKVWTDSDLYQHFGLTKKEIEHIEKSIKSLN